LGEINKVQGSLSSAYSNHDEFEDEEKDSEMIKFTKGHPRYSNFT
jgi:hypothetical protein